MANDIIDINVYETTETVSITVNPNLTTININEVSGVGGSQNLQSVTNFGNTTTTSITANSFIKSGGTGANVLLDNGTTTLLANLGTKNDINSKQLQLNYLDRDNSIFDAFYLRTIADGGTFEASNQLLSSLAVLRNISYVNQGYTQQINADKFVKLGGAADEYLMADGSISFGGGGGGGATNLSTTQTSTNFTINSNTGTDATVPLGNGTLAGATLNDYTTTEKNKLAGIATGATVGVPYTGAVSDVNLGEFGIQLGNLEFDNTPTNIPTAAGSMYYNDTDGTLDLKLKGGNVTLQIGQEQVIRVVNKTATSIDLLEANYQAVRITGAQGQRVKVDLAQATNDVLSSETIGLVTETIANNQEGFITTSGLVRGINTTGSLQSETWLDGDILYLSPTVAGRITKVKPIAPNHLITIGYVISAHITQGTIFVKVNSGYEISELHDVKITTPADNNVLAYTSATDIWENKTVETALGFTPYNATNPSGYQTASQVQTIADAKVTQTITNGVTTSAPSQDAVFDALTLKANDASVVHLTGNETIAGTKTFSSNPKIPLNFGNSGLGGIVIDNGAGQIEVGSNYYFPSLTEISYVKGVTSAIQTQFSGKQDALQSTVNIKSINGNSILGSGDLVISATAASQGAFTVLANNTSASAVPTEQVFKSVAQQSYTNTITWTAGTAPSSATNSYSWMQIGNMVNVRLNLVYSVAGTTVSAASCPLPSDCPIPLTPSGLGSGGHVLYYGSGTLQTVGTVPVTPVAVTACLRLNLGGGGYDLYIQRSSGGHSVGYITVTYFTS